jgi:hypothetical protein
MAKLLKPRSAVMGVSQSAAISAVNKGWDGKTLDLEAIPSISGNDPRAAYLSADMTYTRHRPGLAHPQRRHPSRHAPLRNVRGRRCDADVMRH